MKPFQKIAKCLNRSNFNTLVWMILVLTFLFAFQKESIAMGNADTAQNTTFSGEPFIIIDSIEFQGSLQDLVTSLSAEDIYLMTILKDSTVKTALAAYGYGNRVAKNGLLIIETMSHYLIRSLREQQEARGKIGQLYQEILGVWKISDSVVDEAPSYPSGEVARIRFLSENIEYPRTARANNIEGVVYTSFVIGRDGKVTDIKIIKGIGGGCDEEVVRVIKRMPKWIPGKKDGETVNVQFMMPIKFTLEPDPTKTKKR